MFTKAFSECHFQSLFNRKTNMSLLLLLEDFNVLMLTDCKFVDL